MQPITEIPWLLYLFTLAILSQPIELSGQSILNFATAPRRSMLRKRNLRLRPHHCISRRLMMYQRALCSPLVITRRLLQQLSRSRDRTAAANTAHVAKHAVARVLSAHPLTRLDGYAHDASSWDSGISSRGHPRLPSSYFGNKKSIVHEIGCVANCRKLSLLCTFVMTCLIWQREG